jgi:hypothetical protein
MLCINSLRNLQCVLPPRGVRVASSCDMQMAFMYNSIADFLALYTTWTSTNQQVAIHSIRPVRPHALPVFVLTARQKPLLAETLD